MNRRQALKASAVALTVPLAGCASQETETPHFGKIFVDETTLNVEVETPELVEAVEFDPQREDPTTDSISEENPIATYELGDFETIGTRNQQLYNNTTIDIKLLDSDGDSQRSEEWKLSPELELTDVIPAKDFEGDTGDVHESTTPILEVTNTGTGPTRIKEIVVFNPSQNVSLQTSETGGVSFATAAIAKIPSEEPMQPVEAHEEDAFFIGEGQSAYLALDDLLHHEGDRPESTESATQTFDIRLDWLFDDPVYRVVANLTGGIESVGDTYRFNEFEIEDVSFASPIK